MQGIICSKIGYAVEGGMRCLILKSRYSCEKCYDMVFTFGSIANHKSL